MGVTEKGVDVGRASNAKGKLAARRSADNAVRSARAECLAAVALEEPPQLEPLQFLLTFAPRRWRPTSLSLNIYVVVVKRRRKRRGGDYRASACDAVTSSTRSAPFLTYVT